MKTAHKKGGKKNRKYGRNQNFCTSYKALATELRNKKRKLRRHMKNYPNDLQAAKAFASIE